MTKKQLLKQRAEIDAQLRSLEVQERLKTGTKLIGKCFRYRNSYGSLDSWCLYLQVLGLADDGFFRVVQFEIDSNGWPSSRIEMRFSLGSSYTLITFEEYSEARERFIQSVNDLIYSEAQP